MACFREFWLLICTNILTAKIIIIKKADYKI